jgi:hypothetical protein
LLARDSAISASTERELNMTKTETLTSIAQCLLRCRFPRHNRPSRNTITETVIKCAPMLDADNIETNDARLELYRRYGWMETCQ